MSYLKKCQKMIKIDYHVYDVKTPKEMPIPYLDIKHQVLTNYFAKCYRALDNYYIEEILPNLCCEDVEMLKVGYLDSIVYSFYCKQCGQRIGEFGINLGEKK